MKKLLVILALSAGAFLALPRPAAASHDHCRSPYGYGYFSGAYYNPPVVYYRTYRAYPRYYVARPYYRSHYYRPRAQVYFGFSVRR